MKRLFSLTILVVTVVGVTLGSSGQSLAAEPAWWHDDCVGGILSCGQWTAGAPVTPDCGPVAARGDKGGDRDLGDVTVDVDGNTVTVTVENSRLSHRIKTAKIRVEGTGATGAPGNVDVTGPNNNDPDSDVEFTVDDIGEAAGAWRVEVTATITPQPDAVVLTFDVPAALRVISVDDIWAWDCCIINEWIPAVSEWGLLVMALLGLAVGTIMFRRSRAVAA